MIDLSLLQEFGVLGTLMIGMGVLLRWMVQKNANQIDTMIQRSFIQADKTLELVEGTIKQNSEALRVMHETILKNIQSKNTLVRAIEDQTEMFKNNLSECKQSRDKQFREIIRKQ